MKTRFLRWGPERCGCGLMPNMVGLADGGWVQFSGADAEMRYLEDRVRELQAALWLIAQDEALAHSVEGGPFFVVPYSDEDVFALALHAGDMFAWATADAEPFGLDQAPMLMELAKREGWPGLVRWIAERRKAVPIPPVTEAMEKYDTALSEARGRIVELEAENERLRLVVVEG